MADIHDPEVFFETWPLIDAYRLGLASSVLHFAWEQLYDEPDGIWTDLTAPLVADALAINAGPAWRAMRDLTLAGALKRWQRARGGKAAYRLGPLGEWAGIPWRGGLTAGAVAARVDERLGLFAPSGEIRARRVARDRENPARRVARDLEQSRATGRARLDGNRARAARARLHADGRRVSLSLIENTPPPDPHDHDDTSHRRTTAGEGRVLAAIHAKTGQWVRSERWRQRLRDAIDRPDIDLDCIEDEIRRAGDLGPPLLVELVEAVATAQVALGDYGASEEALARKRSFLESRRQGLANQLATYVQHDAGEEHIERIASELAACETELVAIGGGA